MSSICNERKIINGIGGVGTSAKTLADVVAKLVS